jgi:hypothetical protein
MACAMALDHRGITPAARRGTLCLRSRPEPTAPNSTRGLSIAGPRSPPSEKARSTGPMPASAPREGRPAREEHRAHGERRNRETACDHAMLEVPPPAGWRRPPPGCPPAGRGGGRFLDPPPRQRRATLRNRQPARRKGTRGRGCRASRPSLTGGSGGQATSAARDHARRRGGPARAPARRSSPRGHASPWPAARTPRLASSSATYQRRPRAPKSARPRARARRRVVPRPSSREATSAASLMALPRVASSASRAERAVSSVTGP